MPQLKIGFLFLGKKIVANKWFREVANILTRPCGLKPDL